MLTPDFHEQNGYWVSRATIFLVSNVFSKEEVENICGKIEENKDQFVHSGPTSFLCQVLLGCESLFISVSIDCTTMELPREKWYTRAPDFVAEVIAVTLPMDEHSQLTRTHDRDSLPKKYTDIDVIFLD